eukprot:7002318-Prymnesium_polylepis.1
MVSHRRAVRGLCTKRSLHEIGCSIGMRVGAGMLHDIDQTCSATLVGSGSAGGGGEKRSLQTSGREQGWGERSPRCTQSSGTLCSRTPENGASPH